LTIGKVSDRTNATENMVLIVHESSGTTTTGFGSVIKFNADRSGGTVQAQGTIGFVADVNTSSNLSSAFVVQTALSGSTSEKMRVASSGLATFQGLNDGTNFLITSGTDNNYLALGAATNFGSNNGGQTKWTIRWRGRPTDGGHKLQIVDEVNSATRVTIDNNGNFGIGGSSASYKLLVTVSENQGTQLNYNTNASFTQDLHNWATNRAGSADFNFGRWQTNVASSADNEYIFNGAGTATADGAWNGGGADYAEYFEWADGNSSSQDRVGISVKLDGTKIVASTSSDDASAIIGVISANPSVVGDTAGCKWQSKYERDDYNRYIWEEYTVTEWTVPATETEEEVLHSYQTDYIPSGLTAPDDATVILKDDNNKTLMRRKLNSDFDSSVTYVTRSDRKEWDMVGLMGKLRMTKGQKTGANWIKMKDISDTVEEWLVR